MMKVGRSCVVLIPRFPSVFEFQFVAVEGVKSGVGDTQAAASPEPGAG
jgi:hypothetical protein